MEADVWGSLTERLSVNYWNYFVGFCGIDVDVSLKALQGFNVVPAVA
jgi:hypothetical protein